MFWVSRNHIQCEKSPKIFHICYSQAGGGLTPPPLTVSLTVKYPYFFWRLPLQLCAMMHVMLIFWGSNLAFVPMATPSLFPLLVFAFDCHSIWLDLIIQRQNVNICQSCNYLDNSMSFHDLLAINVSPDHNSRRNPYSLLWTLHSALVSEKRSQWSVYKYSKCPLAWPNLRC